MNAAALMGQVRTAVHATAGAHPAEVLARTNRLLTDLEPGLFTSCVYAHIDLAARTAHLATAGHPPPLLRHAGAPAKMLHLPPGLLLGIDPDASYTAVEIPFEPGTLLALYTDGLVEVPGEDLEDGIAAVAARITATHQRHPLSTLADELIGQALGGAPVPTTSPCSCCATPRRGGTRDRAREYVRLRGSGSPPYFCGARFPV